MKNSSRSFVASYRGFGLLAGIILCVATFATVVWHAGAQGNGGVRREVSKKLVPGEGLLPADVDCSKIREKHIDMQENLAAGAILAYCGWFGPDATVEGMEERDRDPYSVDDSEAPFAYGGTDVNVKPSSPSIQSESFVWGNGTTVVAAYNDLATCTGGISTSTDGGVTWAVTGAAVCSGHGTNFGDPAVVYDPVRLKWVAMFLASGCGGQGIGAWNSTDGITWATAGCAANVSSGNGDRNSAWADNNPTSPFYGRVYASYNDFSLGGGALRTVFSTDGGTTWSTPVTVFASFRRDIQMTGDLTGTNGYVYLGGMDEGGGGANNRNNYLYRSTDGGVTWNAGVLQNPAYAPPGVAVCSGNSYFYTMTPQIRHMGWGQPAAGPGGVVHYVYAQHGTGADEGNIMYVRSTDSGLTWAAPIQLNTDAGLRAQWMPSISVSPTGAVFVKWYDRRDTSNNDYWIYGRASTNNGVSWQPDMAVSDAVIPQPTVQTSNCYMGDYDYHSSTAINNLVTWTDSRGSGSGGTQDVFFDKVLGLTTPLPTPTPTPGVPTPTPTITPTPTVTPTPCGANNNYSVASSTGATIVATSTDTGNHCDDCNTNVALPFSYSLYGQSFSSVNVDSNGNMGFTTADDGFSNSCLPDAVANNAIFPHWDDLRTDTGGGCASYTGGTCGIYTSTTGTAPNRIFNIEWRAVYFATATNQANFEVRLYEGQNRFDVIYGILPGLGASATVGVQKDTGSLFTQYECNTGGLSAGQQLAFTQAICGTPTPGATPTPTRTPTPTPGVTPSPTATATPSASPCGSPAWTAGATLPAAAPLVRSAGVYFPANGKFYGMGGRSADTAGSDYTHPFEYTPGTNTWVAKAATYPDNQVNNMACGVGTVSGTAQIYCVGGSAAGQTTATARVFSYNPVTDTIATLAAGDNWPGDAAGTILPGGFTVNGNKLYIIGGFNINVASTNQIWEFDPTAAVGSKWLQRVNTPVGIMYAPSAAIGGIIYVGGGSDYSGGTVIDTTNSFSFNPTANTIGAIAAIPRAVGETRGLNFNGKLLVMGGGRVAPNPSNIVNIYDPGTNTWTTGSPVPSFVTARRNFPTDTDGTSKIYLIGGYDTTGVGFVTTMEIFSGAACATPTPATTPTPAATPTPTPTVTPTPCSQNYTFALGSGTITPAATDTGNHGDDVTSTFPLPFPVSIYGQTFSGNATVGSNGILSFGTAGNAFSGSCLPVAAATMQLMPFYRDQRTDAVGGCVGCGIFTAVTGTAPNRMLSFEYKTYYFGETSTGPTLDYEVNLFENGSPFNFTYGLVNATTQTGRITSIGVQANATSFTQFACDSTGLTPPVSTGQKLTWTLATCGTPTPAATPTSTPAVTPTRTPTPTPAASPSCSPAAWSAGPPQAPARYAIQGALGTDNMLYIAGGQSAENPPLLISTQVSRYNSTTNTWSNVAPLPVPLSQAATAAGANGKIYVAGGSLDGVSVVTNALRIYDIASNTWSSGPAIPTSPGVEAAASAVVNGKLYVMGGDDGTNGLNTNFVYDIAANTWTTGATLPSARTNTYGTAASNGMIYVYGGVVLPAFTTVDNLLRYNPATNTWTDLGSAGTGGHGNYGGISPYGTGQLLITDGALNTGVSGNTTHIFTISSGTFSAGPSMIGNRAGHAQGTLPDGRVLVADGFNTATTVTSAVELLGASCTSATPTPAATPTTTPTVSVSPTPACTPGSAWVAKASMPIDEYGGSATSNGTFMYVAGGYSFSGGGQVTNFSRYDTATNTWTSLAAVPDINSGLASLVYSAVNNKIYMFGGDNATTGTVVNSTRIYDPATNTWSAGANMPDVRAFMASGYFNNKIYLVGGYSTGNVTPAFAQVWEYDPVANTFNTTRLDMPHALGGAGSGVINGHLYVAGGRDAANTTLNSLYDYNIAANTWATKANLPALTNVPASGVVNGQLWIFGGGNPFSVPETTGTTQYYTPATDTWTAGPTMLTARSFPSGTNVGNLLVAAGGYNGSTTVATAESLLAGCPSGSPTPTPVVTPTTPPTPSPTPTGGANTMQFSSNAYVDNESNTATITVTRVGVLTGISTVNYATSPGTATGGAACVNGSGVDYVNASGTLTFNPTVASQTFSVILCPDNLTEPDETVNLTLSAPTGGTLGSPSTAILTINDTATTFENQTGIAINQGAAGAPYPSTISVSGAPTIIGGMRVTLYHYTANNPDNTDVLLVSPGGIKFILMAAAGGNTAITGDGVTLNFIDSAGQVLPDNGPLATADYEPTSWGPVSAFPAPAPSPPYNEPGSAVGGTGTQTLAGNFNGTNANGTWSLYVRDHFALDQPDVVVGNFARGWGIEFLAPTAAEASISGRVQTSDGRGIRNARVTISGNSLPEARVVATGSFGYFSFGGLTVGETYVVTVNSQRYTFTVPSRVFTLVDNIADADFIADPGER